MKRAAILVFVLFVAADSYSRPLPSTTKERITLTTEQFSQTVLFEDRLAKIWVNYFSFEAWLKEGVMDNLSSDGVRRKCSDALLYFSDAFSKKDSVAFNDVPFIMDSLHVVSFLVKVLEKGEAHIYNKRAKLFEKSIDVSKKVTYHDRSKRGGRIIRKFTGTRGRLVFPMQVWYWAEPDELLEPLVPSREWGSCEDGTSEAKADAEQGKFRMKSYGLLHKPHYPNFHLYTAKELLVREYGIEYEDMGCIYYEAYRCYNDYMDSLISLRFGKDIFERCAAKADTLNRRQLVKTRPEFPGGKTELSKYFLEKMRLHPDSIKGMPVARFRVNHDGSLSGIEKLGNDPYSDGLVKAIAGMTKWKPALNGLDEPVASDVYISIVPWNQEYISVWYEENHGLSYEEYIKTR